MGIKGAALADAIHQARIKTVDEWRQNTAGQA